MTKINIMRKRLLATNGVNIYAAAIRYLDGNTHRGTINKYDANFDKPTEAEAIEDLLSEKKKPECVEIQSVSVYRPESRPPSLVGN